MIKLQGDRIPDTHIGGSMKNKSNQFSGDYKKNMGHNKDQDGKRYHQIELK